MTPFTISTSPTPEESDRLDTLLWEVLWKPLNLPPSFRESVTVKGKEYEHIALQDGEVVGGLVAICTPGPDCEMRHIAVLPRFQNQGCGMMLLRSILTSAQDRGVSRIHTIARRSSAAFFEKAGFRRIEDIIPDHPAFLSHGISFVMMERAGKLNTSSEKMDGNNR